MALSELARAFINGYQGGFPIDETRPFAYLAKSLDTSEASLLGLVRALVDAGYLSRFGPIYDASRLGGGQTLAALNVPAGRFDAVAAKVNALPAVAHNYRREHALNMWFVIAAPSPTEIDSTLREIELGTGLQVYNFPKQHEFYLGLWLSLDEQGDVDTVPVPTMQRAAPQPLDAVDYRVIAATQAGLPLVEEPAEELGRQIGMEPGEVVGHLQGMLGSGAIRRIGAVPNHYRLGLRGNGMTVWDVPDELAVELGEQVGALDFVSHSYLRPRYDGVWPYNLFAMVHGRGRDEVRAKTERIAGVLAPHCRAHDVLFSSKVLKKTGLRLAA